MKFWNSKAALLVYTITILWLVTTASAQVTTLQFATGVGTPAGAVVLSGSTINPSTGHPYRHLWTADAVNGICRMDPDLDTQSAHAINPATCINTVLGVPLNPGALAFDSTNNDLYVIDGGGKFGVFRLHILPAGDNGLGLLSSTQQEVLGGSVSGGKLTGGCGIALNVPHGIALGPDGNLYLGFSRVGTLMRILAPQTEPLSCTNVQSDIGSTADAKKDVGLAWIGHTLFGIDGRSTFAIPNADQCFTPQNGFIPCPPPVGGIISFVAGSTAITSDQAYPAVNGTKVYFGTSTQVFRFDLTSSTTSIYGSTNFSFITGLAVDIPPTGSEVLYLGDDPSNGLVAGQGRWWQLLSAPPPPGPPATPTNVSALAGNAQATVGWNPTLNGQPTTSYTVRNTFVSAGVPIPDVIVTAPTGSSVVPISVTISGLTNGVSYQFAVEASNTQGSSAFSTPSNLVTPQAPSAPSAPAAVSAAAGNASAAVGWTVPTNTGGSTITSYTVTALVNGVPVGIGATVSGAITSTTITGLTNGTTYTFTVHATNALGSSPESLPSNAVTPQAITVPGAPTAVTATAGNAQATVAWTAPANNGGSAITSYTVSAQTGGVTVLSVQVSGTATSTIVSGLTNGTTYTFLVSATNQAGTGAASLPSNAVTPAFPSTTTDIQVVGSAQNGGPSSTGSDVFTWQIKDNQSVVANGVSFKTSLPAGMVFQSVSSNMGSCSGPAPGTAGATVSCSLSSLPGGQTMVVTVNVTFNTTGTMTTSGAATFVGTDTNPANNSFSVTIGVK